LEGVSASRLLSARVGRRSERRQDVQCEMRDVAKRAIAWTETRTGTDA
jgi:hypothetical protein